MKFIYLFLLDLFFYFAFEIFNNVAYLIYRISTLYKFIIIGNKILFKFEGNIGAAKLSLH